jgi:uncharacterized protein (DUF433 family)
MELESYFDFLTADDIRISGSRIGIETVLDDYLNGSSPEEIAARYRSLSLEAVYATITYYLHNQDELDRYLHEWRVYADTAASYAKTAKTPAVERLLGEKRQQEYPTQDAAEI